MQAHNAVTQLRPLTVLVVVPTLQAGAAEMGAVDLVRILTAAGHHAIVMSRGGRLEPRIAAAGGEFIYVDVASKNPAIMARNAAVISRIVRNRKCDIIHVHGRAPAWSALVASKLTRVPLRHQLVQGLPRTECAEAAVQQCDGAR